MQGIGANYSSVIQGSGEVPTINCTNISTDTTVITGFKIYGYYGVRCAGSVNALKIDNNNIAVVYTGGPQVSYGYGIYLDNGAAAVITGNYISYCGVAIYGSGNNNVEITGNTLFFNRASGGSGIYLNGGTALIKGNTIQNSWDGALLLYSGTTANIINNKIIGNYSWSMPAGISIYNSTATFSNNIIAQNVVYSAPYGPGLNAYNSTLSFYNNLFYQNWGSSGSAYAAAAYVNNTNLVAKNNIISGNGNGQASFTFTGTGTQDFSYNDLWANSSGTDTSGITPGPGNIAADPLFLSFSDFHLGSGSPCINAGDPNPQYNDKDSTRNDMGVYGGPNSF